jgi:hypothetical protein
MFVFDLLINKGLDSTTSIVLWCDNRLRFIVLILVLCQV